MYVLPVGMSARSTTKWGLSGLTLRRPLDIGAWNRPGLSGRIPPGRINDVRRSLGGYIWRNGRGLGDDVVIETQDVPLGPLQVQTFPNLPQITTPPVNIQQPGIDPAIQQAFQNLQTSAVKSTDPLDYVSPQAAIAAGLPPQTVYNAWSASLAKFPTQQAALAAGIPAGVVTQLWAASRTAAPVSTASIFSGSTFGIPNAALAAGGGLLLLAVVAKGRR